MSQFDSGAIAVYGHFSQALRGNPLTQKVGEESDAAPFTNWNEQITETCYRPNAEMENFKRISYSFSDSLLVWLKKRATDVYEKIIASDRETAESPSGNALATAFHHSILPLARRRDKQTQVAWGIAAYEYRYGRKPLGFWLPEMALDRETLSVLAKAGIRYTIISEKQVQGPLEHGAGPYKVKLDDGHEIGVFVRNDPLTAQLAFNIHNLGGAGHWARTTLSAARRGSNDLLLLATAGETFGHHYQGEEQFLYWLLTHEVGAVGYQPVTLDAYFIAHPPKHTIKINEPSSWSDKQGITHWATGHVTTTTDTTWKGALRRALDNAASEIDVAYQTLTQAYKLSPWDLREAYGAVQIGTVTAEDFLAQQAATLDADERKKLAQLLQAEELAQRMYTSYTFTSDELYSTHPRYAIACAAAALSLAQNATQNDLTERLLSDLAVVKNGASDETGVNILWDVLEDYAIPLAFP